MHALGALIHAADPPGSSPSCLGDAHGAIELSWPSVALSAACLIINGLIGLFLDLGINWQLAVASVRWELWRRLWTAARYARPVGGSAYRPMIVQLTLLSFILKPIFEYNEMWLVVTYGSFMMIVATIEAMGRPQYTYKGMFLNTFLSMALSSGLILIYVVMVVMSLTPWWEAQYFIPLLGMLLGNCTSAVSLGLNTILDDLTTHCSGIEWQLAMGANRWEATGPAIRRAIKTAITPLLNQMNVMGLVAIPGMMTGQILAGADPGNASRYQMLILFIIGGSSCLSTVISVFAATFHVVDHHHCFRQDRLKRKAVRANMLAPLWAATHGWLSRLGDCLWRSFCCCLAPKSTTARGAAVGGGLGRAPGAQVAQRGAGKGAKEGDAEDGSGREREPLLGAGQRARVGSDVSVGSGSGVGVAVVVVNGA
ncbi:hypothetical protein FOA52_008876 [Chlamydomonas sp. UWO 241]|nr:hypothetical protein FOA52_008876 [Chlamydomonas sp. UWO 241]